MIAEYTQLILSGLKSSIFYAFLGALIGLLIVILLNKLGYLKREHSFLKVITKLYYVIFPIVFFFFFWFTGSLWQTKMQVEETVDTVLEAIKMDIAPSFEAFLNQKLQEYIAVDELPPNEEIVQFFLNENTEYLGTNIFNYVLKSGLNLLLETVIGTGMDRVKAIEGASVSILGPPFEVLKMQLHTLINRYAVPFFIPIFLLFFSAMLLPTIEICWANRKINLEEKSNPLSE